MSLAGAVILQVIPDLSAGGAERTTIEVAEALKAAGAVPLVASAGGRLESELERAGGELVIMPKIGSKNPVDMLANAAALGKLIRARNVALVHARSRAPAWSALWAARGAKVPFVTTYHGVYNARTAPKKFYNSVMARGDRIIANSNFTADHVRRQYPKVANRIVVIPRGVDIAKFSQEAVAPERRASLAKDWFIDAWRERPGDKALILLPARLTGWKGHREAIDAAAILAGNKALPQSLDWRMIFAGDAQGREAYENELHALIHSHGLDDRIALVGHCADMPAALALSDIVIAPSNEPEAFGRVAAEAGAMGLPVIGSNLGGQKEVIVDGETGLLTPPGDPVDLAAALASLLQRGPEGWKAMGKAARQRIAEKYTKTALQRATLSVYDELTGRPK
jgi:glycosyltransferase involved in cell wall biosynthesis